MKIPSGARVMLPLLCAVLLQLSLADNSRGLVGNITDSPSAAPSLAVDAATEAPTSDSATEAPTLSIALGDDATEAPSEAPTSDSATEAPTLSIALGDDATEAPSEAPTSDSASEAPSVDYTTEAPTSSDLTSAPTAAPSLEESFGTPSASPSIHTRRPTAWPTSSSHHLYRPTRAPTYKATSAPTAVGSPSRSPTPYPTVVMSVSDKQIFGYDVGSRVGNVAVLVSLILVILWVGLSLAYCLSRGDSKSIPRIRTKKSRRQKFEEYWGDIDDSAHSTTGFNLQDRSSERDEESQHSADMSFNGLMSIPLGGDGRR